MAWVAVGVLLAGCGPATPARHPAAVATQSAKATTAPSQAQRRGTDAPPPLAAVAGLPPGFQPAALAFWQQSRGLLAGSVCHAGACRGRIAVTENGGRSWRVRDRTRAPVTSVSTVGAGYGWASMPVRGGCAGDVIGCPGRLVRTFNWGKNWYPMPRSGLSTITFATPQNGWALAAGGAQAPSLFATTDGGTAWRHVSNPCPRAWPDPRGSSFASAEHGWTLCTGQPGVGRQGKAVLATTDGGRTWQPEVEVPFGSAGVGGLPATGYPVGIFFLPDGHGWLWEERGGLYATTDGGRIWQALSVTRPESVEARAVWFVSDRVGFALLRDNPQGSKDLVETRDGGATWTTLHRWPLPPP